MSDLAVHRYRRLVRELWVARALAGGDLSQDEEADRAEELDSWWEQMDAEERATMEKELRDPAALKPHAVEAPHELPARPGA
jgi:hypothetical protein